MSQPFPKAECTNTNPHRNSFRKKIRTLYICYFKLFPKGINCLFVQTLIIYMHNQTLLLTAMFFLNNLSKENKKENNTNIYMDIFRTFLWLKKWTPDKKENFRIIQTGNKLPNHNVTSIRAGVKRFHNECLDKNGPG